MNRTRFLPMGSGLAIGAALGIILDNLALWIALGVVFECALRKKSEKEKDKNDNI